MGGAATGPKGQGISRERRWGLSQAGPALEEHLSCGLRRGEGAHWGAWGLARPSLCLLGSLRRACMLTGSVCDSRLEGGEEAVV